MQNSLDKINKFLKANFTKKLNLQRALMIAIAAFVVIVCSWPMHSWAMNSIVARHNIGGFIEINIILNGGVSFSFFDGHSGFIYAIQTLMVLLLTSVVLFTKKWFLNLSSGIATIGGLFNLIDRMCPKNLACSPGVVNDSVLDYFQFFGKSAIFNFPDVFIIVGVIGFCIGIICVTFTENENKNKKKVKENDKSKK